MNIKEYDLECTSEHVLLTAVIGGRELWYRFPPGYRMDRPGDALVAASLFPAMQAGEPLEVNPALPVSPRLLQGLDTIQDVFSCWYPMLRKVRIHARAEVGEPAALEVGAFFSGGVDGAYTFLKHADEVTHLVFVKGLDMELDNNTLFQQSLASNQRLAEEYKKTLVPVETNVRFFEHAFKVWWGTISHGGGLASIALAMGFRKMFIGSTHMYTELFPWGSHPLTDRLWSNDRTEIVHDGAEAPRSEKLRRITRHEPLINNLRVCAEDSGYNCGRCEKCLRTMVALRALGVTTPALPRLDSVTPIARLRIENVNELDFWEDNLRLARVAGDEPLTQALARCILRYRTRWWLTELDQLMFAGRLRRLKSLLADWRRSRPSPGRTSKSK